MSDSKKLYRSIYNDLNIPVHMSPDWMDAVCVKGDWDVIIERSNSGEVEGVLVYHFRKILGFTFILMPQFCFYNGIWLNYKEDLTNYQRHSFEHKLTNKLIDALPEFSFYYQQYPSSFKNWAPLLWKGFKQSTRYTYRIDTSRSQEELHSGLKANLKRNIKKAEGTCLIKSCEFEEFWAALNDSYAQRSNPFNKEILQRLYNALSPKAKCTLNLCVDKETNMVLAGNFIVYDDLCSYYLCGFYNPAGKEKAGLSYLIWYNIKHNQRDIFDLEGSMIKDIEYFFRSYSGEWVPHYRIWKINSWISPLIKWKFKRVINA